MLNRTAAAAWRGRWRFHFAWCTLTYLKLALLIILVGLTGCSWFHPKKASPPERPELTVTGAPAGSILFMDGVQVAQANEERDRPQVLVVAPGPHTIEVRQRGAVAYREEVEVALGEKRVIAVLAGTGSN